MRSCWHLHRAIFFVRFVHQSNQYAGAQVYLCSGRFRHLAHGMSNNNDCFAEDGCGATTCSSACLHSARMILLPAHMLRTNTYIGGHKKTPKHTHHWRSEKKVKKHKIVHLLLLYQQHHQQQELQLLLFLVSGRIRHDVVSDVVGATTFRRARESPRRGRRRLPAARPRDKQVRSKTAPSSTVLVTYQREQMKTIEERLELEKRPCPPYMQAMHVPTSSQRPFP